MRLEVLHKISSHRDAGLRSAWSHRDDAAHAESRGIDLARAAERKQESRGIDRYQKRCKEYRGTYRFLEILACVLQPVLEILACVNK